jgi:phosphoglycerate kinase
VAKRTIRDLDLRGKRVFIRVDFNISKNIITGYDTRIRAALPTIQHALNNGAACVVLASHLGRPRGTTSSKLSLRPVAKRLSELMGFEVTFADDCIGPEAKTAVTGALDGGVVLLENLRFHVGEERNDNNFAKQLAELVDVYVDDAFGVVHRAHASVDALARQIPDAAAGLLLERELRYLTDVLSSPDRPFVAVLGGAKVSDKISVIENLLPKVNCLLVGGAMAYTFLKAQHLPVGKSLVEDDKLNDARNLLKRAAVHNVPLLLPVDHVVAGALDAKVRAETISVTDPAIGDRMGLDIGPRTATKFTKNLRDAGTVVWNGPMGVFEIDTFARGTIAIAEAVANVPGTTIIGGGDSITAVTAAGVSDRITHISTGGGASLEFLGGGTLPGVAVLPDV